MRSCLTELSSGGTPRQKKPSVPCLLPTVPTVVLGDRGGARRGRPSMTSLRLKELSRLFKDRYGGELLPNDDAGQDDLEIFAHHLAQLTNPRGRILSCIELRAPWMKPAEAELFVKSILSTRSRLTADRLAQRLGLTMDDRMRLRIGTIGAIDCDRASREKARRARSRTASKKRRAAAGATARERSRTRTKPWNDMGVSRATWYRRRKDHIHETSSAHQSNIVAAQDCLTLNPNEKDRSGGRRERARLKRDSEQAPARPGRELQFGLGP